MPGTDPRSEGSGPSPAAPSPAPPAAPSDHSGSNHAASAALLSEILDEARDAGFLGPGPIDIHLRHAEGFAAVCRRLWPDGATPPALLDLGSGGGLPGLVVAVRRPQSSLCLLDANGRRTAFLTTAVRRLGLAERVSVLQARAEAAGRDPGLRGHFDGVLARSFGRPAVVAECAAPLLRPEGWLVVSEPPGGSADLSDGSSTPSPVAGRWPAEPLAQFGLMPGEVIHEGFDYQALRQTGPCPDRFPRRDGVPGKRPLF